jgi:hypothetical protein
MVKFERGVTWAVLIAAICYFQWKLAEAEQHELAGVTDRGDDFELAQPMGQMQKYMDKLHFAGLEGNWQLAGFYLHELEEQAEKIVEADVGEGVVDVSKLTQQLLVSQIEQLESLVEAGDSVQYKSGYLELVDRCNSCHQASNHGFIMIRVPELSMFKNQEYGKPL